MITWITGNSGSGKTRLAKALQSEYGGVILDGDDMRGCWELGFSADDRWEQNKRVAKIARVIDKQGVDVIVATICPYKQLRKQVYNITNCKFIYLDGGKSGKEYPYESEEPK